MFVSTHVYSGEYFDRHRGEYYLRARSFSPRLGRFTQPDPHWTIANMVFGDNPRRMNEREDPLGLNHYTMMPDIHAIMQTGNLYVFAINNPVYWVDPSGRFVVPVILPLIERLAPYVMKYGEKAAHWIGNKAKQVGNVFSGWFGGGTATQFGNATLQHGSSKREMLMNTVQNNRLMNAVNEIYRQGATFGDGGLASAVRHELATGQLVGGRSHLLKASERISNLENIIRTQTLSQNDLDIARQLLNDLNNALGR